MSALIEFRETWSRLGENELGAVKGIALNSDFRRRFLVVAKYLESQHRSEIQHREALATRQHLTPWQDCTGAELVTWFNAATAIRRAAVHSNVFQEWASLLCDSVCEEMASRLTAESLFSKLIQEA